MNNHSLSMHVVSSTALWPTVLVVLIAAAIDLRTQRIPNWLSMPFLMGGLVAAGSGRGWSGLGVSLIGVIAAAAAVGVFCYLGAMGMGDLKLFAGIGAWLGPSQLFTALLYTGVAGGVIAVCWALTGGFLVQTMRSTASLIASLTRDGLRPHETIILSNPLSRRMPYAPAIAIGTICSFLGRH